MYAKLNYCLGEEELKSLSAFSDFVSTLDLDDLGGGGGDKEPDADEK